MKTGLLNTMTFLAQALSLAGGNHAADLEKAEADFARTNAEINRDLDLQLHESTVKLARTIVSEDWGAGAWLCHFGCDESFPLVPLCPIKSMAPVLAIAGMVARVVDRIAL